MHFCFPKSFCNVLMIQLDSAKNCIRIFHFYVAKKDVRSSIIEIIETRTHTKHTRYDHGDA